MPSQMFASPNTVFDTGSANDQYFITGYPLF